MKYRVVYKFYETEKKAREACKKVQKKYAHAQVQKTTHCWTVCLAIVDNMAEGAEVVKKLFDLGFDCAIQKIEE